MKKQYLRLTISLLILIIVCLSIFVLGGSFFIENNDNQWIYKGWNNNSPSVDSLYSVFQNKLFFGKISRLAFPISISLLSLSIIYPVYILINIILLSFKVKDSSMNNINLVIDIIYYVFILIIMIVFILSLVAIRDDFYTLSNDSEKESLHKKFKFGTNFIINIILLISSCVMLLSFNIYVYLDKIKKAFKTSKISSKKNS
ncbi:hypothetical protein SCORR_v1c09750 [Spiroplasma corruscae]|uniref:Transmembrane protein n=1 Tax=Spiroplasma corruscae TaxID=216934 RepID=A0A222EQF6_9MOLU|nr:hypothetical protein [Spiroplasma corruscae]ASP28747.1 hypothetical protein SCORR_v1c09750 [Spiroplasma corruscae]